MKFNVLDLEQRIAEIEKTGSSVLSWGTGNRVQVTPRSRVFLLRQEVEPRGLVGVGEIDGDVRDVPHFDPAKRQEAAQSHLVDVRWTALSREPFVPLTQLVKETGNDTVWSSQSSGVNCPQR